MGSTDGFQPPRSRPGCRRRPSARGLFGPGWCGDRERGPCRRGLALAGGHPDADALPGPSWGRHLSPGGRERIDRIGGGVQPDRGAPTSRHETGPGEPPPDAVETNERPLADEDAETQPIVFRGRVVDPKGHPFSGARLYLNYFNWPERDSAPPLRATSDADGRFRFSVERSYFELPHLERWRSARVVALADGFGPGGSDSDEIDAGRDLTVRLARDDVPINGRLVDLEGRPVVGATVRVERISGPTGGDLTPWIKAVSAREGTKYDLAFRYLKFEMAFANFPVPSRVTTGQDGRFTFRGIGREHSGRAAASRARRSVRWKLP